ncbi:MAG: CocE/NonD family hydrolase [Acidimicrobiales bacterium]
MPRRGGEQPGNRLHAVAGPGRARRRARRRVTAPTIALLAAAVLLPLAVPVAAGAASSPAPAAPVATTTATFTAHGSIGQAYVLGATPGAHLLVVRSGRTVGRGTADHAGSLIVRGLPPGPGYQVRQVKGAAVATTPAFSVLGVHSTPPASFYAHQHLHAGLNYLTMRDGIRLAATVRLPPGKTLADGPFPTVVEYSGYPIAAPGSLITSVLHPGSPTNDPTLLPTSATAVGSLIAPLLGFASVSLQMRGTGCSGGAFDLFGLSTTYDGYDAVQIVGSQPWVAHHKVGLVGISFSGISQLFVAGTRPPDLAAAAPLSVTNDLYTTGYPGGMFNSGFAGSWVKARVAAAEPAPAGGETYARALIARGTRQCLANQDLRLQTQNVEQVLQASTHRTLALYNPRTPTAWARHIDVPVYLAGAFQDEQTGPQWPAVVPALRHDPHVWVTMVNGTHVDSLGPAVLSRWLEFLDIFVARQVPHISPLIEAASGSLYSLLVHAPAEPLPPLRFTGAPDAAAARQDFERQTPRVRVLFDNGGGSLGPGALQPEWQAGFTAWPPPQAVTTTFDLGPGGRMGAAAPRHAATVAFRPDPASRPATDLPATADVWAAQPPYHWTPVTGSDGLGFESPVLTKDLVAVGPASLRLELRSSALDTDLQATVTEVMPDGQEMYVQSGFLRASDRALTPVASTAAQPVPTYLARTARPLPRGRFTEVRVPIDPLGFAFRAGDRIRVTLTAPGGTRPAWAFNTYTTHGKITDTVALGGARPSALVLSVVPGLHVPDGPPACGALRGQPCRTYVAAGNGG